MSDSLYFGISGNSEDAPCNTMVIINNNRPHNRCQPCTAEKNRQFLPILNP
jgi:hypothetical protein